MNHFGIAKVETWMWKKLLKLRPLAMQLTKKEVNSGATTSFWFEKWSSIGQLIELTGARGCMDLGIPINSTVEKAIQLYRVRRHRAHSLRQVDREIMALKNKGLNQLDDICLWKRENGDFKTDFRTSHTWNLVRSSSPKVSWVKGVWFTEATPRFSFLVWLAIHDRLATGDRILRWNPQAVSTCWLCNTEAETRDHLFFECSFSKEVWIGTIKHLAGRGEVYKWDRVLRIVEKGLHKWSSTVLLRYCFQAVAYALWHERNVRRVGEASQPATYLIARLDKLIRNRISSLRRKV